MAVGLPVMINIDSVGDITDLTRAFHGTTGAVVLAGVDRETLAEAVAALRVFPNWYLETSQLLAPGCLRLAVDCVGADRVLFGTGAPARPIASGLHTVRFAGLQQSTVAQILGANSRRLLGLT